MNSTATMASHMPEIGAPKRIIDYIDAFQEENGLSDQQISEKLGLRSVDDLTLLRTGLVRPSMNMLPNLCTELGWSLGVGVLAMSAEHHLDFILNVVDAMIRFRVKDYQPVLDACNDVKNGEKSFVNISLNGIGVMVFKEE